MSEREIFRFRLHEFCHLTKGEFCSQLLTCEISLSLIGVTAALGTVSAHVGTMRNSRNGNQDITGKENPLFATREDVGAFGGTDLFGFVVT